MSLYYNFDMNKVPEIHEIGGKAESLIKLTLGGFNVPQGVVLTVAFFNEWIEDLKSKVLSLEKDKVWKDPSQFKSISAKLKAHGEGLAFSKNQKSIIDSLIKSLGEEKMYAVRSSSPEEDLTGASFAGGYETILGVTRKRILHAIKQAFLSCMDERVFFYKHQNGFDPSEIRIAVIIQEQINSESSGVGFSLNPVNNCYDEVVINANSGLGESVVSGMITPDEFVVNKVDRSIIEKKLGSKEQAIVLCNEEGTRFVEGLKDRFSISDLQVQKLLDLVTSVEEYYGFPVDIEWAISNNKLYLLQSRPITTYVPLPDEMLTEKDQDLILFMDASLVKQGITTPISVLGCDCIGVTQSIMFKKMMGKDVTADVKGGMATTIGGRMYLNVSSSIKFQGRDRFIKSWEMIDALTLELLKNNDLNKYIPSKTPDAMKGALWGALKSNIGTIKLLRRAIKDPEEYKRWYQSYENDFDEYLKTVSQSNENILILIEEITENYIELLDKMLPMTYAAELSRKKISKLLKKTTENAQEKMQYLERSLPDNVTVDMGLEMYELSQMSDIRENDYQEFKSKLDMGSLSTEFMNAWSLYLDQYGCRTRNELDVGVPRTSENIQLLFEQIKGMSSVQNELSPKAIYEKSQSVRKEIYENLSNELPQGSRKKLESYYSSLVTLGGKREALKYWYIKALTTIRELLIKYANTIVESKKLDSVEDVFWLHLDQVDQLTRVKKEKAYEWIDENKKYYEKLTQVNQFPKLIDSRGKILMMPKADQKDGELVGQPISPGVVTGRVKVLSSPDEKALLPGEIMVTRATDPGWTPLFINAAAILLEVGGLLQHGALVAREYGKPCIAGLDDVMNALTDGQLVEVDASRGIVRILED